MIKRIGLFLLTNILVIVTIGIVTNLLGLQPYMGAHGINYTDLAIWCLIWGMGGSFISLQMSRWIAKQAMGVQVIDPQNAGQFAWLVDMVTQISKSAGLPKVPEIGIYDSPEMNAFATGPSQRRSLVAFSSGIVRQMDRNELAGVTAHELAHIKNGDMVTMTLLQGVINAFVLFLSRIIAFVVSQQVKEESRFMVHMAVDIVLQILLSILGSLVVLGFSRHREFRADAGAAKFVGKQPMIDALKVLSHGRILQNDSAAVATLKISGKRQSGIGRLFASHPPIEERIRALENMA